MHFCHRSFVIDQCQLSPIHGLAGFSIPKLLKQRRDLVWLHHYRCRTEQACFSRLRWFIVVATKRNTAANVGSRIYLI